MSKKIKGLICALLAGMMVTTSCGLTSLAADEDTSAETTAETTATEEPTEESTLEEGAADADITDEEKEAQDAAEATATPSATEEAAAEATEAPSTGAYDDDTYYQNALQLCSALGIIQGYEDGSVQPESTVTRAEMATIILRMLNTTSTSTYANVFLDVAADHWAANNIQTAVEQSIVNGMGDGTFQPDGSVTYEQVIKMLVCALNYGIDAERAGGYPNGYISVGGTSLSLLSGVNGQMGEAMQRGDVIKAVYNAINAPYREIVRFDNNSPVYSAVDTLGIAKFDLYEDDGILTATPNMTITAGTQTKDGRVVIDGVEYICALTGIDDLLGTPVEFYYIDSNTDDPEIIAMYADGDSDSYTFDADMISEMDYEAGDLRVYTSETGTNTRRYNIGSATVMYNGSVMTAADFAASEYADDMSFNDFIVPEVGNVQIIDYDGDGTYDVLMINKYETMLVTNATSERLSGKINNVDTVIDVEDDVDKTITVSKSGSEATVRNLRKNDVASIKRNIDDTMIDIVVTGETITGTIESVMQDEEDGTEIVVNGQEYEVDANAEENVRNGASVILYLDMFDRVGYIESSTGSMLSSSEKYAVVANAYVEDNGDAVVKLINQDGESLTLTMADTVRFWGPRDTESSTVSSSEVIDIASSDELFVQCDNMPVKLCKYRANSEGKITMLYFATAATDENESTDALRIYTNNSGNASLANTSSVGGAVAGYYIEDGIVEFTIPNTEADRRNPANYSVGEVSSSSYTIYDGGTTVSFAIADFVNSRYPSVLVKFEAGSNTVAPLSDIDTAGNNPTFMLSRIVEAVDEEDNRIFNLVGYSGGAEVTYTTSSNTGVYDINVAAMRDDRQYTGECIFDATKDDAEMLTDLIQPGDIFIVANGGKTLGRLINIEDVAKTAVTGSDDAVIAVNGISYNQGSRDTYFAGFATQVDIADSAFITISDYARSAEGGVAYDTSALFNYVTLTVDSNGNIIDTEVDESGGMEPGEILCYGDDPAEFDYGFFKLFKGSMQNGYIIRIQIEN